MSPRQSVAIVTGGAGGIGEAIVRALTGAGVRVAVADIALSAAQRLVGDLPAPDLAFGVEVDVSDESSVQRMIAAVVGRFGRLDFLVNNAVLGTPDVISHDALITEMDCALWDRAMAVNLRGPMLCSKHAIPHMIKAGAGSIVNISSVGGQTGGGPPAYGCSKAGLERLTSLVASQFGKQRIRCNAVAPSMTRTAGYLANVDPRVADALKEGLLLPDIAEPAQVASVVAFLLSDGASHITGQTINVDGGYGLKAGAEVAAAHALARS